MSDEEEKIDPVTKVPFKEGDYDGIRELKNPSPKWWTILFAVLLVWGVGYFILYPILPGIGGVLGTTDRKALAKTLKEKTSPLVDKIEQTSLEDIQTDPNLYIFARSFGEQVFKGNCSSCHGVNAAGTMYEYPSLVDNDWLWKHGINDLEQTVRYGIRSGNPNSRPTLDMPTFGWMEEGLRNQTADYVLSLQPDVPTLPATSNGAVAYKENCSSCHGESGEGLEDYGSPRLNDKIWLFRPLKKQAILEQMITAKKGQMPSWEGRLSDTEIKAVVTYVNSLTSQK